ncbi:thiamine ABC transporter substrate-binding protein [Nocardioides campestrisoli]|uniref:thiamine ABC transporter substrate-binding protein n=1 Tax=Nocardioides campestrisoli TaxID=2736757 RepID=UPI00163DC45A|nr:thiamine ABC transporter substrate-binding protein [Nocardioides campestrisoli]
MKRPALLATVGVVGLGLLAACSTGGTTSAEESGPERSREVILVTHDSFTLPEELLEEFAEQTGQELIVRASGDAGALSAKLALTKENPTGDVAFGIDNTFASRVLDEGVFAPVEVELPPGAEEYALADGADRLVPVDVGHVCLNIDDTWFDKNEVKPPRTLQDLTKPAYEDLTVVPAASTSSPGMAFLLSTVAAFGDEWPDYWQELLDNGLKVVDGWSDAYYTDFTQGGENGDRPIVLSYDSSPAFTVAEGQKRSTTSALLETCFRQVEYAGVLDGAPNPEGARALVEFLTGPEVQAALPESMFVFPVDPTVELPDAWAEYAVQPEQPFEVDSEEIAANREQWLQQWTEITTR